MNTKGTKATKGHEGRGINGTPRRRILRCLLAGILTLPGVAVDAAAQPATLVNASVETRAVAGALGPVVDDVARRATGPTWVGYSVPAALGHGRSCCGGGDMCCGSCRLENDRGERYSVQTSGGARLEPAGSLVVFARLADGAVERVRMYSEDCGIDGTGVTPAESVAWLGSLVESAGGRGVANGALAALASHDGEPAVDRLIALARKGSVTRTRSQALFWLAQRASTRAIGAIDEALTNDPETAVKRQAVFALSQLPADEGVPRLIDVARAHSNQAVRRQAMFWLGQSKDPRALDFFAEILKR